MWLHPAEPSSCPQMLHTLRATEQPTLVSFLMPPSICGDKGLVFRRRSI
jgi:hypothetical protein